MSDIIEHSINALEAKSKNDPILKEKLALLNLVEYGGSMPTPDRIIQSSLKKLLKSSKGNEKLLASNLVSIFKWHGPEVLLNSPKISNQFWVALNKLPSPENVSKQATTDIQAKEAELLEINRKKARIKQNRDALKVEDQNNTGSYFRDTEDTRSDEELDAEFNTQPGIF